MRLLLTLTTKLLFLLKCSHNNASFAMYYNANFLTVLLHHHLQLTIRSGYLGNGILAPWLGLLFQLCLKEQVQTECCHWACNSVLTLSKHVCTWHEAICFFYSVYQFPTCPSPHVWHAYNQTRRHKYRPPHNAIIIDSSLNGLK